MGWLGTAGSTSKEEDDVEEVRSRGTSERTTVCFPISEVSKSLGETAAADLLGRGPREALMKVEATEKG